MRMAVEGSLWVTVRALVAGQVPDDQRLVAGTRKEHVGVLERGRKGSDPSCVALKGALENQLLSHGCCSHRIGPEDSVGSVKVL